uniref:Hom-end-associated Hint domain-containing protein n=1 Tax=viral metagenome TaxID=1070528 RepID=A0A6C0D3C1_9ZZZZ
MELKIKELNVDLIAPSSKSYMNPEQGGSKLVIIGKPGCFAPSTIFLIWDGKDRSMMGIIAVEDIQIGDYLVGPQYEQQHVIGLCHGEEEMYRIQYYQTQHDDSFIIENRHDSFIIVNRHHILTLWNIEKKRIEDIPLTAFLNDYCSIDNYEWMIAEKMNTKEKEIIYQKMKWDYTLEGNGEYFGFELEGECAENHRCLLSDGSIVHNTGKTTLITSLLYEKSSIFPIGLVMSGTEDSNGHYRRIFPSSFVYNSLREKTIEDFITRQKVAKMHVSNPWAILLLDDCTDDPKILNKPLFQGLYKNGRHWKMLYILSLQYCMDVKPVVRTNIDGTFILRESSLRNRKVLWENYASIIPDFSTFCAIMDSATSDYTALYIHNATQSNKIEDCVFWYRAKPVPPGFKFGSPDFWKFDKQRFDPEYKDSYSY